MKRSLRHRFWLPLLLFVVGFLHHRKTSNHYGLVFVNAAEDCVANQCIANCQCVLPDPDNVTCAINFGKYGWIPADDSKNEVWKEMDREYEIDYGKIQPTGMRGANRVMGIGRGIGKIVNITNTTLTGEVYFEGHPDQIVENLGRNPESLIVELYGGIQFGLKPCSQEGIMLGHRLINMTGYDDAVNNFDYAVELFDDYNAILRNQSIECHPRSTNGRLGKVTFSLDNWFYYNEQSPSIMNLWYPSRIGNLNGNLGFCIHLELIDVNYNSEDDDFDDDYFQKRNVTSWMDTKFKVEVSAPSAENGFSRFDEEINEVKVYSNQPFGPVEGTTTYQPLRYKESEIVDTESPTSAPTSAPTEPTEIVIPVKSFQCGAPDESYIPGTYNHDRTFQKGQTFRICVGPSVAYEKAYRVIGFQSVVCKNNDRNSTIIDEYGDPNNLTTIDRQTIGFTREKGGIITSNHTMSINSIITADLAGDFDAGKKYFTCTGIVYFASTLLEQGLDGSEIELATIPPTLTGTGTATGIDEMIGDALEEKAVSEDDDEPYQRFHPNTRSLLLNLPLGPRGSSSSSSSNNNKNKNEGNNEDLEQWDKIALPIVGTLRIRIEITPETTQLETQVTGFVDKSVNTVKQWFTSSASSNSLHRGYILRILYGTSFLLPIIVFT